MGGVSSGATPWWQLPPTGARPNLEQSSPNGYVYDPVQMGYERTPTSAGQRLGQAINGLRGTGALDGFGSSGSASASGTSGSPSLFPPISYGGAGASGSVAPVTVDTGALDAANSAAFGHAKDQAAQTTSAALTGLSGELQRRGMGGAGYEGGQIGATLGREANTIGEASRAEAGNRAGVAQHVADENFQGRVAQRGQDIGASDAAFSGGIAQRGQNFAAQDAEAKNQLAAQSLAQQKALATQAMLANVLRSFQPSF